MNLFEHQAKGLFKRYGIPVPKGVVVSSPRDMEKVARRLGGYGPWVVKAQVLAGGRGKSGGVKICRTGEELDKAVRGLLGSQLAIHNGAYMVPVRKVLVEEFVPHEGEYYIAIMLDRKTRWPMVTFSCRGGIDIEDAVRDDPGSLATIPLNSLGGFLRYKLRNLLLDVCPSASDYNAFGMLAESMTKLYWGVDAILVEINPVVRLAGGGFLALDAKVEIDENAFFRQATLSRQYHSLLTDKVERQAARAKVSYVRLDGNIGCMVNGAGLAMATMDAIKEKGGSPANFLDVGGGVDQEGLKKALKILGSDGRVKGIFINIFGGIVKCDLVAAALLAVLPGLERKVPVVVRLEGTNRDVAIEMLKGSRLSLTFATDMDEGAAAIVGLTGRR